MTGMSKHSEELKGWAAEGLVRVGIDLGDGQANWAAVDGGASSVKERSLSAGRGWRSCAWMEWRRAVGARGSKWRAKNMAR